MPRSQEDAWKLYNRLAKERPPTERQLEYLFEGLGYKGAKPATLYEASLLIDRQKRGDKSPGISPEERREAWVTGRREKFRKQIEQDIAYNKTEYESGRVHDDFRLLGWALDFGDGTRCPEKKKLKDLIYLAQIQVSDIVDHLPPFDDCPIGCWDCQLQYTCLVDAIDDDYESANIQYVKWDSPQFRASVPKHIFTVFDNHKSFAGAQQTPTKTLSVLYTLIAFVFRVIYKVVCTLFRKAVEFEKEHKVLQKIAAKIADKAKELGLPFVVIGITIAVVLLILIWLVFLAL